MQQIQSKENCLLYLGNDVDPDEVVPHNVFPPGDRCPNCSILTGVAGDSPYGVIILPAGAVLDENNVPVFPDQGGRKPKSVCIFDCRVPSNVQVISG